MKKIFTLFTLLFVTLQLSAGPIGESRARQIAEVFFAEHATTRSATTLKLEWAGDVISESSTRSTDLENALIYIYTRGTNEGFVIIAGDDNIDPIIGYSFETTFDSENMAEATKDIIDAWGKQVNAARNGQLSANVTTRTSTLYNEVLLYETALWNQSEPYNREAPTINGSRSVTGCAATAMSIICKFNKWPNKGVGTTPAYSYVDNSGITRSVPANTLGRTYDYDNMLQSYDNGYNNTQANAVAALMKDMGTAIKMNYNPDGSSAKDSDVAQAFINHFGYSKQSILACRVGYTSKEWHEIMRTNLENYGPTFFSGQGDDGGHAFILDGYATNDYFHFNFGWSGYNNGYFRMPEIDYYAEQKALLYLAPDKDGTSKYRDNIQLYAIELANGEIMRGITSYEDKYVANNSFQIMFGGFINYGSRTFSGDIALMQCNKNGELKKQLFTMAVDNLGIQYFTYSNSYHNISIDNIEDGDVLRVYFRSSDSDEWIWARAYSAEADDEIQICATPEQVAENLSFTYNKAENVIYIQSPDAFQIDLDNGTSSGAFTGHSQGTIQSSLLNKGEHTLKISNSGRAYELKIKL